jgi:hypothetical protein
MYIKRFIDKVSHLESTKTKDLVLPMSEARLLRDEIAKLLLDLHNKPVDKSNDTIKIEVQGGSFK